MNSREKESRSMLMMAANVLQKSNNAGSFDERKDKKIMPAFCCLHLPLPISPGGFILQYATGGSFPRTDPLPHVRRNCRHKGMDMRAIPQRNTTG